MSAKGHKNADLWVLQSETPNVRHHAVSEAELAAVVDVDILVEEVGAGTGVHFRGGALPLVVAEHLLPQTPTAGTSTCLGLCRETRQAEQQQIEIHLHLLEPHICAL